MQVLFCGLSSLTHFPYSDDPSSSPSPSPLERDKPLSLGFLGIPSNHLGFYCALQVCLTSPGGSKSQEGNTLFSAFVLSPLINRQACSGRILGVACVGEPVWILTMKGQNDALVTLISLESSFPSTSVQINLEHSLCLPTAPFPCHLHLFRLACSFVYVRPSFCHVIFFSLKKCV